jgi:hypothetical protein
MDNKVIIILKGIQDPMFFIEILNSLERWNCKLGLRTLSRPWESDGQMGGLERFVLRNKSS